MKLSSITTRGLFSAAKMILVLPAALMTRFFRPDIWIITERPDQARDNGYCFFQYMKREHPEQPLYYIIDKDAKDLKKIESLGSIISFDSWKHFFYYCLSTVHISAHVNGCNPRNNPFAKRTKKLLGYKDVFIPHGVSYGISEFCLEKYAKIDLFICCGKQEYENILNNYGYRKDQVALTGFPRLDEWHNIRGEKKNQILLMPTWRLYLAQNKDTVIKETSFYCAYQGLINNQELIRFLKDKQLKLIFYLHYGMQKYADAFSTVNDHIEIVTDENEYDIQELLKESALLITDYSSVHFDFAYMGKPIIYYQFDQREFFKRQYKQSDFVAERDGFGPVAYDGNALIKYLQKAYDEEFVLQNPYLQRMENFYVLRDDHNCDRVYKEIKNRWGKTVQKSV